MRKCRLLKVKTSFNLYKGEMYKRSVLTFEIMLFGFYRYEKRNKRK